MFKNTNSRRITLILLSLVLVTSLFIGGSIARYITSTSSEDNARVAKWGFSETAEPVTMDLFKNEYKLEDNTVVAKSNDDADIIAPGLNGVSKFKFVTSSVEPEVMYEVKISIDDSEIADEIKNHPGIQWKVDNGNWVTWDEMVASLVSLSGDPSGTKVYAPGELHNNFKNTAEHTIAWQWVMDSGYDEEDTRIGNLTTSGTPITAKIVVTVLARQTDIDSTGMLEGNGSVYNTNDPQPLTFRADADYESFDKIEIDGTEVNPSNYETTPGSIKVKLKKEYLKTLARGFHKITIKTKHGKNIESKFTVTDNSAIIHSGIIPEGGTYYVGGTVPTRDTTLASGIGDYSTATAIYTAGSKFPTPQIGDVYVYGDFEYRYGFEFLNMWKWLKIESEDIDGWSVRLIDKTKNSPGVILTSIANMNVTNFHCAFSMSDIINVPQIPETAKIMTLAFYSCPELTISPTIPKSVTDWDRLFYGCSSLTEISNIPNTVTSLYSAFSDCVSLEIVPVIPNSVINMNSAFFNCRSLKTIPNFPNKVQNIGSAFWGCYSLESAPTIPETVDSLYYTFYECHRLTTAPAVPKSVTTMTNAFDSCSRLKTIEINAINLKYYTDAFKNSGVTWITGSISDDLKQSIAEKSNITLVNPNN